MNPTVIIGAGGFVGTRLVESLALSGKRGIRCVVRSYRSFPALCRFGDILDVRLANAEYTAELASALSGADTAVNITTGPPAGIIRATRAIHEACLLAGVRRLIHMSSAVVYGDASAAILDDHPPLVKHWMPYARAKSASEIWLRERLGNPRLEVNVLRPGVVWGVRSPHTHNIARALANKQTFLVSGGQGIFNGIYVDNLVSCIRAACDHARNIEGFFNVGDQETVSWLQFYRALGVPLGCDPLQLPKVSGIRFPHSFASTVDTLQSLPVVNEMYHRLKVFISDSSKANIRERLEGPYRYDRGPTAYTHRVAVSKELWHLQRVQHKLPISKFVDTFGMVNSVCFQDGICKTLAWLKLLGLVPVAASPILSEASVCAS